jgi:hypothetical protein
MAELLLRLPSRRWLWFGVVGAPLAWAAQEWLGWLLASERCRARGHVMALASGGLVAVHLLALLVAVAALLASVRGLRRAHAARPDNVVLVDRFLATAGTVISAVGIVALVWGSLGTWLLAACEVAR